MLAIIILFVFILVILLSIAMVKSNVDCLKRQDEHIKESTNDKLEFDNYAQTNISGADEIMKYKKLLDEGIISQEEFETKKTQILNRG